MMDSLLELCNSTVKTHRDKHLRSHLSSCFEFKSFHNTKDYELTSLCNRLLNEPSTRRQGVFLLKVYLNLCSSHSIGNNLISWNHNVLKSAQSNFPMAYDVLCQLIEISPQYPECRKNVDQVFVPQLIDHIITTPKKNLVPSVLRCLEACLQFYDRSCKNHAEKIESYLVSLTDCEQEIVSTAAKCFARVQATRTMEYWHERHASQLFTLYSLLDDLFENVHEVLKTNPALPEVRRLKLPNKPALTQMPLIVYFQKLAERFCNLAKYVESTFLVGVGVTRRISVEALLQVVTRVLTVTTSTLAARPSAESSALSAQIPSIHRAVLGILNALILFGRSSLLPYSTMILKLIVQELKSTESKSDGDKKPFEFTREKCFVCLKSWLRVRGSAPSLTPHTQDVINSIFTDIKVSKPSVSLSINVKKPQKKGKGKKNVASSSEIVLGETVSSSSSLCKAALSCLEVLLDSASSILTANDHRSLQETIIKMLLDQMRSTKSLPQPYSDPACRTALLSCLSVLCLKPHPQFPPPLHFAQLIFNSGLTNSSSEVVEKCSSALSCIRHMIRPTCPSFNFPIDCSGMAERVNSEKASAKVVETSNKDCDKNKGKEQDPPAKHTQSNDLHKQNKESPNDVTIISSDPTKLNNSQSKKRHRFEDNKTNKKLKSDLPEIVELSDDDKNWTDDEDVVVESYVVEEVSSSPIDVESNAGSSRDVQEIIVLSDSEKIDQPPSDNATQVEVVEILESQPEVQETLESPESPDNVGDETTKPATSSDPDSGELPKEIPKSPEHMSDEDVDEMLESFVDEAA